MSFDPDKPFRTRDGRLVRQAVRDKGAIAGMVDGVALTWPLSAKHEVSSALDLVNEGVLAEAGVEEELCPVCKQPMAIDEVGGHPYCIFSGPAHGDMPLDDTTAPLALAASELDRAEHHRDVAEIMTKTSEEWRKRAATLETENTRLVRQLGEAEHKLRNLQHRHALAIAHAGFAAGCGADRSWRAVTMTAAWFAVPAVLLLGWAIGIVAPKAAMWADAFAGVAGFLMLPGAVGVTGERSVEEVEHG